MKKNYTVFSFQEKEKKHEVYENKVKGHKSFTNAKGLNASCPIKMHMLMPRSPM